MGLWQGGKIKVHAVDWQFGQNVIADAAGLAPVNANLVSPLPSPSFALTHLLYEHELGGGFAAVVGRNNTLDFWETLYPDYGRGVDGFMNLSIPMPMNATPSMPFITNIAAILKAGERGLQAAFVVMESQESPTTVGLDFPNGVTLVGLARKNTDIGGLRGSHTILVPLERMGIGYFYSALNSDFKNLFVPANPLEDVHGGEVYYNAEITPWFHLTGDLQVINPGPQALDTAVAVGLRAKLDF